MRLKLCHLFSIIIIITILSACNSAKLGTYTNSVLSSSCSRSNVTKVKTIYNEVIIKFNAGYMDSNPDSNMLIACYLTLNKTTYDDVILLFGEPSKIINILDGTKEITYNENLLFKSQVFVFNKESSLISCRENELVNTELEKSIDEEFNNVIKESN